MTVRDVVFNEEEKKRNIYIKRSPEANLDYSSDLCFKYTRFLIPFQNGGANDVSTDIFMRTGYNFVIFFVHNQCGGTNSISLTVSLLIFKMGA